MTITKDDSTKTNVDKTKKHNKISLDDTSKVTVENKEMELQTNKYVNKTLTPEEINAGVELQNTFATFLNDNFDISNDNNIKATVPTGIDLLDCLSGGGIATSLFQVIGPPGSGKTMLASKVLANGQLKYGGKFLGLFADTEESMTTDRLTQLGCVTPIIPYSNLSVEHIFKMIEALCNYKEQHPETMETPYVIVWDSIANTLTEKGLSEADPHKVIGQKALILSHYLPKYVRKMNHYRIALVAVNQLRDKIKMNQFDAPPDLKFLGDRNVPGGKSVLFNSVQLLWIKPGKVINEYGFNGQIVKCKYVKNKLFTPNIDFNLVFSFEKGFSNFWTNYELLKEKKRLKGTSWKTLLNNDTSFRQAGAAELYSTDAQFKKDWDSEVNDLLKNEYIDPYTSLNDTQKDNVY